MAKERYCLEISRSDDKGVLTRNSKELMVIVDRTDKKHSLTIQFPKNGNVSSVPFPPVSDEYTIVKSASKEAFEKSYHLFLRALHQYDLTRGEFFWMKHHNEINGAAWYASAEKQKEGVQFQFFDGPKEFFISVTRIPNWQGIQHFRRAGNVIEAVTFLALFKSLLHFLHDSNEYQRRFRDLVQHFNSAALGDIPEVEPLNKMDLQCDGVLDRVKARLHVLERRLLEIDTDPVDERIKMRGEIEGLRFAISCFT